MEAENIRRGRNQKSITDQIRTDETRLHFLIAFPSFRLCSYWHGYPLNFCSLKNYEVLKTRSLFVGFIIQLRNNNKPCKLKHHSYLRDQRE